MSNKKTAILLKDLPFCPKGRKFKQDLNGNYFHSISDDEYLRGDDIKLKKYKFSGKEVRKSPEWFQLVEKTKDDIIDGIFETFNTIYENRDAETFQQQFDKIVSTWKKIYREDKSMNSLTKTSILKMLRINSSFSIEPTHRFGLHVNFKD